MAPEIPAFGRFLTLELIREALRRFDREAVRVRKLPGELIVHLVVCMGLFRSLSKSDVLDRLAAAVGRSFGWGPSELPHATSITKACDRVGWEPLRWIFRELAARFERQFTRPGWRGLVVRGLDGTTARTPDTAENEAWFGRPGTSRGRGRSAFPQLRLVLVVDVFTHVVTHALLGPYNVSELRLARFVLTQLKEGTLLLLDRAYDSYVWPAALHAGGCLFVVRTRKGHTAKRRKGEKLGKNDRLCTLLRPKVVRPGFPDLPEELPLREITVRRKKCKPVVLLTNLLDPQKYPAAEIARLYELRWESELCYREFKAHLAAEHVTFRSHRPERVLQEAYGLLIAYNCLRALVCEAAEERGISPLRLSFKKALDRVRREFDTADSDDLVLSIGLGRLQDKRVGRRFPRARKPRPAKYPNKRRGEKPNRSRQVWRERARSA